MTIFRWPQTAHLASPARRITLGEGDTPLLSSRRIGPDAGIEPLFFKVETGNPTGSYKDRFAALAISEMKASGTARCLATSSGNTGAALAAYCAAAGIRCDIAVVETAPGWKLRQMLAYGAHIFRVKAFGLDPAATAQTFETLQSLAEASDMSLQISAYTFSPVGMTGVQTISYELAEQAPKPIQHVFCPAGGGGLALAVARGFETSDWRPRIHCVQPAGNSTIAAPLREGASVARSVTCTSQIGGLQVPTVIDGDETLTACHRTGGTGFEVTDEAIWEAQGRLACAEGIFCEPAGAAALAGALQAARSGEIAAGESVVCLVTGSGFKDGPSVERMTASSSIHTLEADELQGYLIADSG